MKTLIILNDIESIQFLIVDGDYSRFHGTVVNGIDTTGYEKEFCNFVWDPEDGERKHLGLWSEEKATIENKDWDKVAICTVLP